MNNPITKIRDVVEVTTGLGRIGASLVAERVRAAAGIPRLRDCDACGGTAYELRTVDGETACISCVNDMLRDADSMLNDVTVAVGEIRSDLFDAHRRATEAEWETRTQRGDHDRARGEWVTERAALMRQRDEAQRERLSEVAKVQDIAIGLREELKSVMRRVEDLKGDLVAANARTIKAESALADLTKIHDEALAALSVAIQRAETAEAAFDKAIECMNMARRNQNGFGTNTASIDFVIGVLRTCRGNLDQSTRPLSELEVES